jgi:hypothetical protein
MFLLESHMTSWDERGYANQAISRGSPHLVSLLSLQSAPFTNKKLAPMIRRLSQPLLYRIRFIFISMPSSPCFR